MIDFWLESFIWIASIFLSMLILGNAMFLFSNCFSRVGLLTPEGWVYFENVCPKKVALTSSIREILDRRNYICTVCICINLYWCSEAYALYFWNLLYKCRSFYVLIFCFICEPFERSTYIYKKGRFYQGNKYVVNLKHVWSSYLDWMWRIFEDVNTCVMSVNGYGSFQFHFQYL